MPEHSINNNSSPLWKEKLSVWAEDNRTHWHGSCTKGLYSGRLTAQALNNCLLHIFILDINCSQNCIYIMFSYHSAFK